MHRLFFIPCSREDGMNAIATVELPEDGLAFPLLQYKTLSSAEQRINRCIFKRSSPGRQRQRLYLVTEDHAAKALLGPEKLDLLLTNHRLSERNNPMFPALRVFALPAKSKKSRCKSVWERNSCWTATHTPSSTTNHHHHQTPNPTPLTTAWSETIYCIFPSSRALPPSHILLQLNTICSPISRLQKLNLILSSNHCTALSARPANSSLPPHNILHEQTRRTPS